MTNCTLKNGTQVPYSRVVVITITLEQLIKEDFICFYELVTKCPDCNHKLFGHTGHQLKRYGLADDAGNIDKLTQNVVLSSTEGDGLDMTLSSPLAAGADQR